MGEKIRYGSFFGFAALLVSCTSSLDGPTPRITSVEPDIICTAQTDQPITLSGSGFSPAVIDGLNSPEVAMPRVFLVSSGGVETEVPSTHISLPGGDTSGNSLEVIIPAGLVGPTAAGETEVVYDIRVVNPNENEGSLSGALTVVPPPSLDAIDPNLGAQDEVVAFTLTGTGFRDGMTVTLDATPAVEAGNVIVASSTEATGEFDLTGVAPGTYDVTVTNSEGCSFTLEEAFTVFADRFDIVGIDPPFGCTCEDTQVTISSTGGFASTPQVEMRPHGANEPVIPFQRVAFIDANTITAVVPGGHDLGDYDVIVVNPPSDPGFALLERGFRVVELPVPDIEAIVPSRGSPQEDTDVTIFGENFRAPVKVELIDRDGNIDATVDNVMTVSNGGTEIGVTLPTTGMTEDAYLVRVTNLDENTFSTFSSFLVATTGPDGNLHPFANETTLLTGRRALAGATAKDTLGNQYFYAIGGDAGVGGGVLDTVEVSQLSKFGQLSPWGDNKNKLNSPRVGAAAVAVPLFDPAGSPFTPIKTYIYVMGGMDAEGTVLGSIERAVVLSSDDAPEVTIAGSAESGTLDAGTWYYKVSAILDPDDPDNPGGETLPSDEAIITIGAGTTAVDLSWNPVTVNGLAAVGYRVYRTDEVDGVSQTEHLIAEVTGTSFTDTGEPAGTESPLPPGATGVWQIDGTSLSTPRWGHQAALITDFATGDRFVFTLGGKSDATTGYLASVAVSIVNNTDGSIGAFDTTNTTPLPTARAFFSLAVETPQNVADFGGVARLFALGGIEADGGADNNQAANLVEFSDVVGGDTPGNQAWTSYADGCGEATCPGDLLTRGGPMAVITSEKLFVLGGAGTVTNDLDLATIRSDGRDVDFDPTGDNGTIGAPIQSTAEALNAPRAMGAVLTGSGFIYFIGGTSDGTDALATTERTF